MCLVEVGSPLKSAFATQRCIQAAGMGTHSRWQAFNQHVMNEKSAIKYVGSVRTGPTVRKFESLFESVQCFLISIPLLQM